jgi:U3 small nucleolar ribonucleoprotein component
MANEPLNLKDLEEWQESKHLDYASRRVGENQVVRLLSRADGKCIVKVGEQEVMFGSAADAVDRFNSELKNRS